MQSKFIKTADIVLALLLLALGLGGFFMLRKNTAAGATVTVRVENKVYDSRPLADGRIEVKSDYGYNIICIENGQVWVEDADCGGKDCMRFGKINKSGQVIICAPHKLIVEIESGQGGPDAVSY